MHSILIIGSGRLARHLTFWNSLSSEPNQILGWNRKQNTEAELEKFLSEADIVWLPISDSSLISFYEEHLLKAKKPVVHFSGALHDSRLVSAHPLMSFPVELMDASVYPKIHFTLTGANSLSEILAAFKNPFSVLDESSKAFYHALCVMAGNFPQLLWSEVFPEFQKLQVPKAAVEIYIRQITNNFIELKEKSLTGPLVRKDHVTIEKNLNSLKNSKLHKIYESFVEVFNK